ncbi:MAG TPA: hypothetical protein IAB58_03210 [Candidatus Pelethosoma merdigallinarum]|nr:hypothetical protein [Candidatus Pelethosoma merdigallinarum]
MGNEERKDNKKVKILTFLLIICVLGFIGYVLVDQGIISFGENKNTTTEKEKEKDDKKEKEESSEEDKGETLDITNANIISMFDHAHFNIGITTDTHIYRDGGYRVSEMSIEEKILLLATQWSPLVEIYNTDDPEYSVYELEESTLKELAEKTFGPGTYEPVNQITDGCVTLEYDANGKKYTHTGFFGCGGINPFHAYESIISATKYEDRIEIVSAVVYFDLESENIYKDYRKATSLGKDPVNQSSIYNNGGSAEDVKKAYDQYINQNKDQLEKYVYTYTLGEDQFYYLSSVARM